jgi:signal transduction histidine kinase
MSILAAQLMTAGGSFLIPTLFTHFIYSLLGIKTRNRSLVICYVVSALFAGLSFTPYMVTDVVPKFYLRNFLVPGPAYLYAVVFFLFCIMHGHYELFKAYATSSGLRRNQLAYFFWSSLFGYIGGSANFLLVFDINIPLLNPFGTYAVTLYVAVTTYAIAKYRLMDISVVFRKGLAYGLLLTTMLAPAYLAVLIGQWATVYAVPPLLAGTLVVACGLWIVLERPSSTTHLTFGLVCGGVSIWLFGLFMVYSTTDSEKAMFWGKFIYLGVIYIPAFFYHFCASFLERSKDNKLILTNYLASTAFLLLIPTSYLINGQYVYFWGFYPKAGVLHPLFLVYFAWVSGLALRKLYLGYRAKEETDPLKATRIKYIFWAFAVGYLASIDFAQSYGLEFYPLGFFFVSFWIGTVSYAVVKHQLLDISVITKTKARPYAQALTLITLFYFVTLMLIRVFTGSTEYLLAGILIATFSILAEILEDLRKKMEEVVGKALFKEKYNAYETLTAFSKTLVMILDLKSLTEEIIRTLVNVLGARAAFLYLLDPEKGAYALSASLGQEPEGLKAMKFKQEEVLARHLARVQTILVREELEHSGEFAATDPLLHALNAMEAEVSIPLINKGRLIGFCNLGSRANLSMYSHEDLNLLETLGQNAAIALDNAILYKDLKRSQGLLRRTDRLRSLETIAGGFAHEIRNPLTSIKTFVQLAHQRKDDPEFMVEFSAVVQDDVLRIERLIEEILDYARYMEPKFSDEDLNEIVAICLHFVEIQADQRSITIEKDLAVDLPRVTLDRQQIKQVLMNLILNAMDAMATAGGQLTVRTHRLTKPTTGDLWVQIEVADTGCGIAGTELEHIFDPFYTTKHESQEREGTGLGLVIVHQIVQEHSGHVEVESEVGRGTTFLVNLPVNPAPVGVPRAGSKQG